MLHDWQDIFVHQQVCNSCCKTVSEMTCTPEAIYFGQFRTIIELYCSSNPDVCRISIRKLCSFYLHFHILLNCAMYTLDAFAKIRYKMLASSDSCN
jgi:hypothetical protein